MTPTNAARDALEDLYGAGMSVTKEELCLFINNHGQTIRSILTALSSVDFELLGAALNSLDKKKAKALYPEVAFACIDPVDFVALEKAARIVADMGE